MQKTDKDDVAAVPPPQVQNNDTPEVKNKPKQSSATKKLAYGVVASVVVLFAAYFGAQLFSAVFLSFGAELYGEDPAATLDKIGESVELQFVYYLLVAFFSLGIVGLFLRSRNVSWREIGMARKPRAGDFTSAALYYVFYFIILLVVTAVAQLFVDADQQQQIGFEAADTVQHLVLVFVSLVILPPIMEEILFRGFLYSGLRTRYTKVTSAIFVSVLFGVAHLQLGNGAPPLWIAMIDTTVLSLILVHLRERTGAIWAGMLVHGFKNGLAFLILFVVK